MLRFLGRNRGLERRELAKPHPMVVISMWSISIYLASLLYTEVQRCLASQESRYAHLSLDLTPHRTPKCHTPTIARGTREEGEGGGGQGGGGLLSTVRASVWESLWAWRDIHFGTSFRSRRCSAWSHPNDSNLHFANALAATVTPCHAIGAPFSPLFSWAPHSCSRG